MGPHSDQPMMATPQAPVHARPQHGAQGYNAFPSFQDIAAGLAAAGKPVPIFSILVASPFLGLEQIIMAISGTQCLGYCNLHQPIKEVTEI